MAWTVTVRDKNVLNGRALYLIEFDPDSATKTIDMTDYDSNIVTAYPVASFLQATHADCDNVVAKQNSSNAYQIDIALKKDSGAAATGNYQDGFVLVMGLYA